VNRNLLLYNLSIYRHLPQTATNSGQQKVTQIGLTLRKGAIALVPTDAHLRRINIEATTKT
jgi:hypothetical protein